MARRTKEDAAITREQLLDAAERVFRERGVAHTSLAEVAADAGVTRGAVYWHFRDKSDLFEAMCGRARLPLEAMLEGAGTTAHENPLGALRELALAALGRLAGDPRVQAVFEVMSHRCERALEMAPAGARTARERNRCLAHVDEVMRQAVAAVQLPADTDTALASEAMHAYVVGLMNEWVLDPSAWDLATRAPALVDLFLSGLSSAPPRTASARRTSNSSVGICK